MHRQTHVASLTHVLHSQQTPRCPGAEVESEWAGSVLHQRHATTCSLELPTETSCCSITVSLSLSHTESRTCIYLVTPSQQKPLCLCSAEAGLPTSIVSFMFSTDFPKDRLPSPPRHNGERKTHEMSASIKAPRSFFICTKQQSTGGSNYRKHRATFRRRS